MRPRLAPLPPHHRHRLPSAGCTSVPIGGRTDLSPRTSPLRCPRNPHATILPGGVQDTPRDLVVHPGSGTWSANVTDTSKDAQRRDEVADTSDRLMERLTTLKATEAEKRQDAMSTPRFHELAEEVTQISRDIFSLALDEERVG